MTKTKKINKKLIIIKYGSNTLVTNGAHNETSIDYENIVAHGRIINHIPHPTIIVSSGAVAFGKTMGNKFEYIKNEVARRRIFSALGNPHLSINWDRAIPKKQVLQGLITHRDLILETPRESIAEIIYSLFNDGTDNSAVIQVNDNDFVTDEELIKIRGGDFGDNDKTTALLAILCDKIFTEVDVIFNTSSNGVLENGSTIPLVPADNLKNSYIEKICDVSKTDTGTGGMNTKLKIIRDMIQNTDKTTTYIINGKNPGQLQDVLRGKSTGTKIYK